MPSSSTPTDQVSPRLIPTSPTRPYNPNEIDARERQKTQDLESAFALSRARSGSISFTGGSHISPSLEHSLPHVHRQYSSTSSNNIRGLDHNNSGISRHGSSGAQEEEDPHFPMLSDAEEAEMSRARGHRSFHELAEEHGLELGSDSGTAAAVISDYALGGVGEEDDHLLGSDTHSMNANTLMMMQGGFSGKNTFDYSGLEEWARTEKIALGGGTVPTMPRPAQQSVDVEESPFTEGGAPFSLHSSLDVGSPHLKFATDDLPSNRDDPPAFVRRRQRKLSHSNPVPHSRRQGKLALFEGSGSNGANFMKTEFSTGSAASQDFNPNIPPQLQPRQESGSGDRPYRFSFYSNALPATIHARSLAELPADGQTFEELFTGRNGAADVESVRNDSGAGTPVGNGNGASAVPTDLLKTTGMKNLTSSQGGFSAHASGTETKTDPESSTWWLDVLCPTDEEMSLLSKVFGIHPLTTEDIQMEEIREKIELFRNYYLVCFRSFDQDPYSQTYLEPLNMYIIVFREGTLSFHFRGTPHPQNVRRRIKQLKDYISVTSDWISYALIDDITDAFGPLIQSIEYEVDNIDELVLILKETEQSDMLRRIGTCRKKVMGLLRLMGNKADVVKGLAKRCNENWSVAPKSDIGLYLSDIQDHLITMTQNLNHYEKILSRSHSNYLAQISIEMTDANNQINDVLSRLTALGTILIPMNLVTGLWGMNVNVPGQGVENLHWFFGIVGVLIAFALVGGFATLRFFKRS